MREGYGALIRRAAAALGVSVALHLAVVSLGVSLPLGALLDAISKDAAPLIVEMIAGEGRQAAPPPPARATRNQPARPIPVSLPATTPLPTEEASPSTESPASAGASTSSIAVASEPSAPAVGETEVARPGEGVSPAESPVAAAPGPPAGDSAELAVTPDSRMDLARLDAVARNPSVSARAAGEPFVGRREVFEFLLDHPEFATHVTRALRVARYRIWRTGDGLFVDDGWGATGQVFVVRAASGTRVLYARGEFQHKLLPAITGEAVVTINYDTQPAADGRDLLVAAISSQLRIDGPFGDLVVKLASAMATEKAEKESRRLVHIFARVLKAIDEKPAALYASLRERPDVPQRELEQFRVLLKLP